jgi:hypothetical protein
MQGNDANSVIEDLGKLDIETKDLEKEFENCDANENEVVGLLEIIGKVIRKVFDF